MVNAQNRSALFEPIANPVLRSFDPKKVSVFKEFAHYKNEEEEKCREVPSMAVAYFKECIELSRLDSMHLLGKFEAIATGTTVENLTSEHIDQFIRGIVTHDDETEVDPTVIEEALRVILLDDRHWHPYIRVPMSIVDL